MHCGYDVLHQLVEPAEWKEVEPRLVNHVKRSTTGNGVGAFWWHDTNPDEDWGFTHIETPVVSFVDILNLPTGA
jgi:hypothetical protein